MTYAWTASCPEVIAMVKADACEAYNLPLGAAVVLLLHYYYVLYWCCWVLCCCCSCVAAMGKEAEADMMVGAVCGMS